jgi:hypothetical protein
MKDYSKTSTTQQLELSLTIVSEVEANGVGMGVLSNGVPYLTGRGLARLCGIDHSTVIKITNDWQVTPAKPRIAKIKEIIKENNTDDAIVFIPVQAGNSIHHAFPEHVCMAILEYYALDAATPNPHAKHAYRTLARKGFTDFVYEQVGLPRGSTSRDLTIKQFMDRIGMVQGAVPQGYFCVFREIADLFADLIAKDAQTGSGFVPDISVGMAWSKYWKSGNLDAVHGMRDKFLHSYPTYFPQSAAGPQEAFCYPDKALPEFRKWMREIYKPKNLPLYLNNKVKQGSIPAPQATVMIDIYKAAGLPAPH